MSYIGAQPTTAAFPYDQFSGNGTTTAFTMSYAPASTTSMVVCISGVVQNPNTYSIVGLTLTFSAAPPTGTNNIGVLYLGIPATSVTTPGNTAYLSSTEFTATAGQTTFTPSGTYQVGFINVIRNGSQLAPSDYTATNGTTVVLNTACTLGDSVVVQVYNLVSVSNALPLTGGTVTGATTFNSTVAVGGAATFSSTATINGGSASGYTGYKNRIINGGMVIDQRNNGASVSVTSTPTYFLDRFLSAEDTDGTLSVQQVSDAPTGFTKSIKFTVGTADSSLTSTQYAYFRQAIEGYNFADLAFGTASAATVTLSFWVKSSVAGLYSGNLASSNHDRCNAFSFTINAANTWEQKTATITGDLTGTWLTTNGVGAYLHFCLCSGSTYLQSSTGVWQAGTFLGVTGTTNFMATAGATFQVTGVQLERGSNATSFEFRDYGRELQMCYRYYQRIQGDASNTYIVNTGAAWVSTAYYSAYPLLTPMRAAPALSYSALSDFLLYFASTTRAPTSFGTAAGPNSVEVYLGFSTATTTGYAGWLRLQPSSTGYIAVSAEL